MASEPRQKPPEAEQPKLSPDQVARRYTSQLQHAGVLVFQEADFDEAHRLAQEPFDSLRPGYN